jgi:hypothetical protein
VDLLKKLHGFDPVFGNLDKNNDFEVNDVNYSDEDDGGGNMEEE